MHTHRTHTHTYKTVYIRIKLYKELYIYQLCNNYRQSLFPFLLMHRHKCLVLSMAG